MIITFVTNFVHHHQLPVADEFYKRIGDDYHYIATTPLPDWLIKGGYDPELEREYIIRTYLSPKHLHKARKLIDESDVVIIGSAPLDWVIQRKSKNKVTFHYSERWFKKVSIRAFTPWVLYKIYKNYFRYRNSRTYMLCASAFTAHDVHLYGCFPNRCFKWGYFTDVNNPTDERINSYKSSRKISFMWCARFLWWKHPELPVQLAARLKKKGYDFSIDMFGGGVKYDSIASLIKELAVEDCVNLCGNRPNKDILNEMSKHDVFLFTSDRNEGWGAVLNESMSCGCVPVASDEIGSVPYLIKNGENGFVFHSCDINSLEITVCNLINKSEIMCDFSQNAVETMKNKWSPRKAAENFLELANYALKNDLEHYTRIEGPAAWEF